MNRLFVLPRSLTTRGTSMLAVLPIKEKAAALETMICAVPVFGAAASLRAPPTTPLPPSSGGEATHDLPNSGPWNGSPSRGQVAVLVIGEVRERIPDEPVPVTVMVPVPSPR